MSTQTFILAISGGVDSIVLLHKLASNRPPRIRYIVAHFDHGIREDSDKDARFVRESAEHYGLQFEIGHGKLGRDASEATARDARYAFLRSLSDKYKAEKIVTAHHQDDLFESMVLGMMRSGGFRALVPMSATDILRPFMSKTKQDLLDYAKQHNLEWRDDPSNDDEVYLRNYVRKHVMPKLEPARSELLAINSEMTDKLLDIDMRTTSLIPSNNTLSRARYAVMPYSVLKEMVRAWLIRSGLTTIDTTLIERVALAIKTLPVGKRIDVTKDLWLVSQRQNLLLTSKTTL